MCGAADAAPHILKAHIEWQRLGPSPLTAAPASKRLGRPSLAIAVHVYNPALWPELAAMVRQVPEPFALFVTMPSESPAKDAVLAEFPRAAVRPVPNLGRDVAPFIALLPELMEFDLVCKVHTKRHMPWRIEALRGVLGGAPLVERIIAAFASRPEVMLAGSGALFIDGFRYIYASGDRLRAFQPEVPTSFGFFAGTVFWTRPQLFTDFVEAFPRAFFVPHGDGDGQLEHLIERLFGVRVATLEGSVGLTRIVDGVPEVEVIAATAPRKVDLDDLVNKRMPARYTGYRGNWYEQQELVTGAPLGAFDPA